MWTWAEFLIELDRTHAPIPLRQLRSTLRGLVLGPRDLRPWLRFHWARCQRTTILSNRAHEVFVCCWRSGQRGPILDHSGAHSVMRVVAGEALLTRFTVTQGRIVYPVRSSALPLGGLASWTPRTIQQVSNMQPAGLELITLHVCSPALPKPAHYHYDPAGAPIANAQQVDKVGRTRGRVARMR